MPKLTQAYINRLKPKEKRYSVSEDGLVVEVNPSGKVVFFAKFYQGGIRHKQKIGDANVLKLADARGELLDIKHKIQIRRESALRSRLTFEQYALGEDVEGNYREYCEAGHKDSNGTLGRLRRQFVDGRNKIGRTRLADITPQMIEAWKASALRRNSPATVHRDLYALKGVFSKAVEHGYIPTSPAQYVKAPKIDSGARRRLMLDESELERLFLTLNTWRDRGHLFSDHPRRSHYPPYLPAIVLLGLHLGLRKSEILQLRFADWDVGSRVIVVRGETTKNGETRYMRMSKHLEEAVREWMQLRILDFTSQEPAGGLGQDGEPNFEVVVSDYNREYIFPIKDFKRSWATFRKMADLEHIVFHVLRHHFASTLVLNGEELTTVRDLMGHKDIRTTNMYLSVRDTTKERAQETHSQHLQRQYERAMQAASRS